MLYTLIILIIGIFIGWNLPQPSWAREIQDRLVSAVKTIMDKGSR